MRTLQNQVLQLLALIGGFLYVANAYAISSISIEIGSLDSPATQARNIKLDYRLGHALKLKGQLKSADDKEWGDASLSCAAFTNPKPGTWSCDGGSLSTARIKLPFSLAITAQKPQLSADLSFNEASFSDVSGLHAGEKVTGKVSIRATQEASLWRWNTAIDWASGEVFWQPFYFASGGHQLQASGQLDQQFLTIDNASLNLKNVGQMTASGQLRLSDKKFESLSLVAPSLDLATLYPLLLKPLLEKTSLNNLEMAGDVGLNLTMKDAELDAFQLQLNNADIEDKNGRFALYKLNANIPWDFDEAKTVKLSYQGGHLLHIPLGVTNLTADLNRYALTAPQLKMPILDGALNLSDVSAARVAGDWHWHLRANLAPITMSELSHALGWPRLQGKVSASIPLVTYTDGQLTTDGAMQFNVFDGTATVTNLTMQEPLGIAPRLSANMQLRNLDLGELTRTFSFGAIEGKLDGNVSNLQLANWQPVNFDASVQSSPGRYPKKISQRAVENISALGGAGAAAAIQRSFLRFFKEFNYDKLGLSCRLRNDICQMDGVESTSQGYIIVKGSGIPSITVMGYNHSVSWGELLSRIKRITDSNTKPVIN
ncbi:MAG TPA: hypothetical protein VIE91_08690 [Methylophilaceae bacterium]|jgi:hypothetical protein